MRREPTGRVEERFSAGLVGDACATVRLLDIRGILVGVSLTVTLDNALGPSRSLSLECWLPVPTDGEPAIVGRCWRLLRREASEALLIVLAGDDVARFADATVERATLEGELLALRLATRCTVDAGKFEICIGGRFIGFEPRLASADEMVYKMN